MVVVFKRKHKLLSRNSLTSLQERYEKSERKLNAAAKAGDRKKLNKAMAEHQSYEYAILYKQLSSAQRKK